VTGRARRASTLNSSVTHQSAENVGCREGVVHSIASDARCGDAEPHDEYLEPGWVDS